MGLPLPIRAAAAAAKSLQSCPTLSDPMDCSLPGFSVHGIFQARVLEWVAFSFSRGSSRPRDRTQVSLIAGRRFTLWATRSSRSIIKYILDKSKTDFWFLLSSNGKSFQESSGRCHSPQLWPPRSPHFPPPHIILSGWNLHPYRGDCLTVIYCSGFNGNTGGAKADCLNLDSGYTSF